MRIIIVCCVALAAFLGCGPEARAGELSAVRSWLLLLNDNLDEAMVSRISQSGYDMVVIDDISSQTGVPADRSRAIVERLRQRPDGRRRVVIAYLNVGQAEDYRTYWHKGWRAGSPRFILGNDPEGWAGNFPVAYWKPAWKALIVGGEGLLARIQDAGFDGVYLDWIGGYEDESVIAAARRNRVDPAHEMVSWVREISAHAKARSASFLVIAQNAAGLLADRSYTAAVDGVAHEDIWYTGADGGTEGDCPVPRTQGDVGSAAYWSTLNAGCRRAYLRQSSGPMHAVGYDAIVPLLTAAKGQGLVVFTVDYAREPAHVEFAVRESRLLGFVPFVGGRRLDSFEAELTVAK